MPPPKPSAPARVDLHAYATVAALTAAEPSLAAADPAALLAALEAAAAAVDAAAGRTFQPYLAARYFTADEFGADAWPSRRPGGYPYPYAYPYPRDSRPYGLYLPDLLVVAELATDDGGTGTYATVWAAADYDLLPYDAPALGEPFTRLCPTGARAFPAASGAIRVGGTWGYSWQTVPSGAQLSAALDATSTAVTVAGATLSPGLSLLVDAEQLYVTDVPAAGGQPMTVVRGAHGSTAAAHANGAPLLRFAYPRPVAGACLRLAASGGTGGGAVAGPLKRETVGDITLEYDTSAAGVSAGEASAAGPIPLGVPTRRRFFA